ncbi:MAG: glutamine synthetase [Alphaproteobacteria bacterium]|nr:glutamine synthetase [Alphaproteobacteria bacterium]
MTEQATHAAPVCFILTNDFAGQTRGRGFPASAREEFLAQGCGWVPANQALSAFDVIAADNPFGSTGDLRLRPDPATEVRVAASDGSMPLHFFLSDIVRLDGSAWDCCPRGYLKGAVNELRERHGLTMRAAFEHEFTLMGLPAKPGPCFSLRAFRAVDGLMGRILDALVRAGVEPEMILPEYGPAQFELPIRPADPLVAADRAIVLREIVRDRAAREGLRATFAPKSNPAGVGNGVHVHFSLFDVDGRPACYEAGGPADLSPVAGSFAAGVLRHLDALVALTAPSTISYLRLKPHHWSAAYACLGLQNREATLRVCPAPTPAHDRARSHHLEFRAADAAASPYLVLGSLIRAGMEGIAARLPAPTPVDRDPSELPPAELQRLGARPLPASLGDALDALARDRVVRGWASETFWNCYLSMKRTELVQLGKLDTEAQCEAYAQVY